MAVATETLQHHELTISEPIRIDAFEGCQVATEEEHFEAVRTGIAFPVVPGLSDARPDLMNFKPEDAERQQRIFSKATSKVIEIAKRYKDGLIASGFMVQDAEAEFNEVVSNGFLAVRECNSLKLSRVLVGPISYLAERKSLKDRSH